MKTILALALLCCSGAALAQESVNAGQLGSWTPRDSSSCDAIYGDGRQLCLADRYHMQQDQKSRDEQSALQHAQAETQQLNNELLRRELAANAGPAPLAAVDLAAIPGYVGWRGENRWFGADRPRTEFALLYAKELHQEQPDLDGRPFLNAVAARVRDVFAPARR